MCQEGDWCLTRKPDRGKPVVCAQELAVGKYRHGLLCPVRRVSPVMIGDPQLMQGHFGEALDSLRWEGKTLLYTAST